MELAELNGLMKSAYRKQFNNNNNNTSSSSSSINNNIVGSDEEEDQEEEDQEVSSKSIQGSNGNGNMQGVEEVAQGKRRNSQGSVGAGGGGGGVDAVKDMWCVLWDVSQCVESPYRPVTPTNSNTNSSESSTSSTSTTGSTTISTSSSTTSSNSFATTAWANASSLYSTQHSILMPTPADTIAAILPVDKYKYINIPEQSQIQSFEVSK